MSLQFTMVSLLTVQARLTQDPQIKEVKTKAGVKEVYELSIASNNYIAKKSSVVYYNVTLWPGRAEILKKGLKKGSAVVISGQFYQNTYIDKHKNEKSVNCINLHSIMLPVCDHPTEGGTDFESLDDNDIVTDTPTESSKHELEETPGKSKRIKK